jgi:hypothetical protein
MRRRLGVFSVIGATLAALAVGGIGILSASAAPQDPNNVAICHATNASDNADNPYNLITPATQGVLNGHFTQHNEPVIWEPGLKEQGIQWGDIIPANTPGIPAEGLNWSAEGQAIYNNGCVPPGFVPPTAPPETKPPETKPAAPQAPKAPAPIKAPARFTG